MVITTSESMDMDLDMLVAVLTVVGLVLTAYATYMTILNKKKRTIWRMSTACRRAGPHTPT